MSGTQKSRLFILAFSSCRLPSGCYSAIATKNLQVASADVVSLKSLELLLHVVFKLPNLILLQRFCDLIHFRHEQGVRFNHIFGLEIPLLCFNNIKRTNKENMHTNSLSSIRPFIKIKRIRSNF